MIKRRRYVNEKAMNINTNNLMKILLVKVFFDLFPTARTFPQIKINGDSIGGYRELEEWSTNKE